MCHLVCSISDKAAGKAVAAGADGLQLGRGQQCLRWRWRLQSIRVDYETRPCVRGRLRTLSCCGQFGSFDTWQMHSPFLSSNTYVHLHLLCVVWAWSLPSCLITGYKHWHLLNVSLLPLPSSCCTYSLLSSGPYHDFSFTCFLFHLRLWLVASRLLSSYIHILDLTWFYTDCWSDLSSTQMTVRPEYKEFCITTCW